MLAVQKNLHKNSSKELREDKYKIVHDLLEEKDEDTEKDLENIPLSDLMAIRKHIEDELNKRVVQDSAGKIFGENLRQILNKGNVNISKLARESGISRSALHNYLRGDRTPSLEIIRKIGQALHIETYKLVVGL